MKYSICIGQKRMGVFLFLLIMSGCSVHRAEWDPNRTSSLREIAANQYDGSISYSVLVGKPNKSHNEILDSLRLSTKDREQVLAVTRILSTMDLNNELADRFAEINVVNSGIAKDAFPLGINFHYGVSADLQIAGIHATIQSNDKDKFPNRCADEFDLVWATGIPVEREMLNGKDIRLVNWYAELRSLFIEMVGEIKSQISMYYENGILSENSRESRSVAFITFDGRVYENTTASIFDKRVLAYRDRLIQTKICDSIHLLSVNKEDLDLIDQMAKKVGISRRSATSRQNFNLEQQNRNQQILYNRVLNRN